MNDSLHTATALAAVALAASMAWAPRVSAQARPQPDALLAKAGSYLADYEKQFAAVVAEEHYIQTSRAATVDAMAAVSSGFRPGNTTERRLISDVIVVNLGESAWMAFRDVFDVDGRPVRDRDERLKKLFTETPGKALAQSAQIAEESARYNLGSIKRNINVPTMALIYLRSSNQPRSTFRMAGSEKVGDMRASVLAFSETARPTVVHSGSVDLPASGRFWIDPETGRVLKTEMIVKSKDFSTKVAVTYAPASGLPVWAPSSMKEEYGSGNGETVTCNAAYTNFRQVAVSTRLIIK